MTYTKQTWDDEPLEDTPISAARLGYMEQGIFDVSALSPTTTQKNALVGTQGTPDTGNAYVTTSDSRMTDSRSASSVTSGALTSSVHIADLFANRPSATAGLNGVRFWATDKMIEYQCIAAAWVVVNVFAPEVAALPGSPVDQQEIIYLADTTNGIKWHLRYRSASASGFKWEAVGSNSPLFSEITTDESTASTTYVDLTTVGPSVTLPLAGDYLIAFGGQVYNATINNGVYITPKLGAATAADVDGITNVSATANAILPVWRSIRRTGLAASAVIKVQTRATVGGTAHYMNRNLEVRPIRVG